MLEKIIGRVSIHISGAMAGPLEEGARPQNGTLEIPITVNHEDGGVSKMVLRANGEIAAKLAQHLESKREMQFVTDGNYNVKNYVVGERQIVRRRY
jgi:hypothetical protein